ncbi:hypothetical protein [Sphingomonas prati]|uniref:Glycosyl transferase n=1 Tax=Sphingomonas prati TaxID=1843237 RepID=A0A7W9F054_9SPHN|nr:hypothetical protein [Sphingomonas prati]MBB5727981.1 hypothetical protein [Sphingomonas prati]GGE82380.1 glycerophosphotransferase [Sphingomonas prati]
MGRTRITDVAVLWLGEPLLIPHLWPIVDALARHRPDLTIDLWVSTSMHEALVMSWLQPHHGGLRIRRAPGFVHITAFAPGQVVPLPPKIPMLARLAGYLAWTKVVLCAEQTSLWLPKMVPFMPPFIFTVHGAGPLNCSRARLSHAHRILIPSALDIPQHRAQGVAAERIVVTGYAKCSFVGGRPARALFGDDRPVLLYAPHWQGHRSSWPAWGPAIVAMLTVQREWNVILAPHQRMFERVPEAKALIEAAGRADHVHVDTGSFATVDGSYTAAADLYLGDTSSQILEYIARPRPCVLLRPPGLSWDASGSGNYWGCGAVVESLGDLSGAIADAGARHGEYRAFQTDLAAAALGECGPGAPLNGARAIAAVVDRRCRVPRAGLVATPS